MLLVNASRTRAIIRLAYGVLAFQTLFIGVFAAQDAPAFDQLLSANSALPEVFRLEAGQCGKFRIGTGGQERQAYFFSTHVTSTTGGCTRKEVLQSLPQDTEHFALAEYDRNTTCKEVREDSPRGQFSTKEELSLDFVPVVDPLSKLVPYMVCTDTSWQTADFQTSDVGPLNTYVFIQNTCNNGSASVAVQLASSANVSAEAYCDRLVAQSSNILTVEVNRLVAAFIGLFIICVGCGLCTACCSCWCCCARSGRCASGCSRSCHRGCASFVTACGLGWIMDKAGGLTFYRTSQHHPLLFWAFATTCTTTIALINVPRFDRDDTLNPDLRDSRSTWGVPEAKGIPAVRFLFSILISLSEAVMAYGVVPVVFSDPVRDPSFHSKAAIAGVLVVASDIEAACVLLDLWRYYHLWPHKAPQIVLQAGVILTHLMTTLTYIAFVCRSGLQRKAMRAKLNFIDPAVTDTASPLAIPAAAVLSPPNGAAAADSVRGSGRRAGPIAEAAEPIVNPDLDGTDDRPGSLGGSATLTLRSPTKFKDEGSAGSPGDDVGPQATRWRSSTDHLPAEISANAVDGHRRRGSGGKGKWGSQDGGRTADMRHSDMGSLAPTAADELGDVPQENSRGRAVAVIEFFWKTFRDVREEPQVGFRYSVFMSATLLVAAIATTSSLMRAAALVLDLSECTDEGSTCLRDAQRWVYNRFLKSLIRVDVDVFEVQASGVCDAVLRGDETAASLVDDDVLSSGETAQACQAVQGLQLLQQEEGHPAWLRDGKTPVLVGGFAAVITAYCISMYTIYHVARAYKKLEIKLKASRLAELLWHKKAINSWIPPAPTVTSSETESATTVSAGSQGSRPTARKARVHLGKDILKDYETVSIGQSAYFTGTLVSTCFFQLWLGALVLGAVLVPILHPAFWTLVGNNIGWVVSFVLILLWHILSQLVLNRYVTDGKRIKRPFVWLFLYIGLSAGYCVVAVLLAAVRLVQLVLTSILALSRLDSCLFTVLRGRDRGYASFLAMALMLHSFQQCLKETADRERRAGPLNAPSAASVSAAPSAARNRWQVAVAQAVAIERAPST